MKTFIIDIDHPGEPDAGFDGYTEEVSVSVLYDAGVALGFGHVGAAGQAAHGEGNCGQGDDDLFHVVF